ncbi:hypothetical protein QX233_08995 [Chryseobacterium gambrini]|uniref:Uncharacterized protein n=1 Tax=Chryseobacterium gambrini TaxID=373672 RepID=A0AAJ1R6R3_9FLAO|nr:hypothetical protein [Chryseobacterium gambrini]MDN4012593.1 hypothetical protein [Chryseobacterium gambrini]
MSCFRSGAGLFVGRGGGRPPPPPPNPKSMKMSSDKAAIGAKPRS